MNCVTLVRRVAMLCGASLALFLSGACTERSYVVGALCNAIGSCPADGGPSGGGSGGVGGMPSGGMAAAGTDAGTTVDSGPTPLSGFVLNFTGSGPARLPHPLLGADPTDFLIADDATAVTWNARVGAGFDVADVNALSLGESSPFADPGATLSHAGAAVFSAQSTWADTSAGALALEVVFRGEPGAVLLSQRDANGGIELALDASGTLNFTLDSAANEVVASSPALVQDAWHHCLALFDQTQAVTQIFCNGHAGVAATVPVGFVVTAVTAPATLGSASAARLRWAELARWQAATWGPRGAWTDLARERFSRLVGTYAQGANEPLPFAEVRASGAYIDMTSAAAPTERSLHPVGEDWPRIVCRPTNDSARACGLLVEAASSQLVAPADFTLDNWMATQLTVTAQGAAGPTGANSLFALTPSATAAAHNVQITVPMGEGPAVLSFFARAEGKKRVRAEVLNVGSAVFDLALPSVVDSTGTLVTSAESWGNGLSRLSFSFDVNPGQGNLRLSVLADDSTAAFAGDGNVAIDIGDVEMRFRSYSTPLPTFGTIQQADHLVYPTGNGNLPSATSFDVSAEVWLPAAPLVADAAILNANFATRYDQQLNLFVRPQDGTVQFWGLQGTAVNWQLPNPQAVNDGNLHQVRAIIDPTGATLTVDSQTTTEPNAQYDVTALDRIEIGTSTSSSGPFTGIIRTLRIAPAN
ncbi:MAG TPA: LamG-like jellyroll fold domain-containing protein [Polyangiaceae bacterium]|nr:LamG-like jellyroll fold domain-containing protein [Polyangiaceae bacterium]